MAGLRKKLLRGLLGRDLYSVFEESASAQREHEYVLATMPETLSSIGPGSICIDCGSHKGLVSEVWLRLGATVYAFEPNIYLFNYSRFRLAEYVQSGKFIPECKAISTVSGYAPLYHAFGYNADSFLNRSSESSTLIRKEENEYKNHPQDASNHVTVPTIDFPDWIATFNQPIDVLKMDIEGAEFDILEELIVTGTYKNIYCILVETHDHVIEKIKDKGERVRQLIRDYEIRNIRLDWQ